MLEFLNEMRIFFNQAFIKKNVFMGFFWFIFSSFVLLKICKHKLKTAFQVIAVCLQVIQFTLRTAYSV